MIVARFLLWTRIASAAQRAQAVAALAGAYLYSDMGGRDRVEAEAALIAVLDDPSPLVRRTLAETLGSAVETPRPIVIALAGDQSNIAALVLARSPVLTDPDLVDCAAVGDAVAQTAIARRPALSASVAAALAEVGAPQALAALADNHAAAIPAFSLRRMFDRHGDDGPLREALLRRSDLPIDVRQGIVAAVAGALSSFVIGCRWLPPARGERAAREAGERATLALAETAPEALAELVGHLRHSRQLTPGLLLRALLGGNLALVEAAFRALSGLPAARVAGFLADRKGAAFAALYRKAGLPEALLPAFRAAIAAVRDGGPSTGPHPSRRVIERVITACEALGEDGAGPVMALLRRCETEAVREEARAYTRTLADGAALAFVIEHDPAALVREDAGDDLRAAA